MANPFSVVEEELVFPKCEKLKLTHPQHIIQMNIIAQKNFMAEEGWEVVPVRRRHKHHSQDREYVQNADDSMQPMIFHIPHTYNMVLQGRYNIRSVKFAKVSLPIIQQLLIRIPGLRIVDDFYFSTLVITDEDMFIAVSAAGENYPIIPRDGSEPYVGSAKMYTIYRTTNHLPVATIETVRSHKYTFLPDTTRIPRYKFSDRFEIHDLMIYPDLEEIPRLVQDVLPLIRSFLY